MGNTARIDDLVDPQAIAQFVNLKTESKALRDEFYLLLQTSIKLNAELGGSTPATFAKNLKAANDSTNQLIANNDKLIANEQKKAAAQESAVNKYLVLLSKQQAERDKADANEIAAAEKKAAKLQAISDKLATDQARKANVQFPSGGRPLSSVEREPDIPSPRYEPVITGNEDMTSASSQATASLQGETTAMTEQKEVLDSLSNSYRANIELLLALKVEQAENSFELKDITVNSAAAGERQVFLTAEQLRLKTAISQTNLTLAQQTKQILAEDTSGAQMQARLDELRVAIGNLSKAELENVEIGGVWLAEAEKLDLAIKALRDSTGDTTKHVGDYARGQAGAAESTNKTGKSFDLLEKVTSRVNSQFIRMIAHFALITIAFGAIEWLYNWIKGFDMFTGRLNQAYQNFTALNQVMKSADNIAGDNIANLKVLYQTTTDVNVSTEKRIEAAEYLKKLYPDILKNSSDAAIMNGQEAASIDRITEAVLKEARADAALAKLKTIEAQRLDIEFTKEKTRNKLANDLRSAVKKGDIKDDFGQNSQNAVTVQQQVNGLTEIATKNLGQLDKQDQVLKQTEDFLIKMAGDSNIADIIEKGSKNKKGPKGNDKANTDLLEFNRIRLEEAKKSAKLILDDENQSYAARNVALRVYLKASRDLVTNSEEILDKDTNLRKQQKINELEKLKNVRLDIDREEIIEAEKIQKQELERLKKYLAEQLAISKEGEQTAIEILDNANNELQRKLTESKDAAENILALKYAKGKIDQKDYNDGILKLNDQFNIDRIRQELLYQESVLAVKEGKRDANVLTAKVNGASPDTIAKIKSEGDKDVQPTKDKVAGLTNDLLNAQAQQEIDNAKKLAQKKKEANDAAIAFAKQTASAVEDLVNRAYENQISKLEKIGRLIDENATIEKAAIDRSLDTQANKARRQAILDAETASQKKVLQAQENAIKTKEAKAAKEESIASIIFNTAAMVMKVGSQTGLLGIPLAPIVLALGAAQLAAAIAAPIPSYKKGTGTGAHQGGLLIYGEAGSERVDLPSGQTYYSPGVATMANLPRGTKITPHNMLPEMPKWTSSKTDNSDVVNAVNENTRAVKQSQPKRGTNRVSGWINEQRRADAWNNYSQNHFK